MRSSSSLPRESGAKRCGQRSAIAATVPSVRRKNTNGSPRIVREKSAPSANSSDHSAAYHAFRRKCALAMLMQEGGRVQHCPVGFPRIVARTFIAHESVLAIVFRDQVAHLGGAQGVVDRVPALRRQVRIGCAQDEQEIAVNLA